MRRLIIILLFALIGILILAWGLASSLSHALIVNITEVPAQYLEPIFIP